MYEERVEHVDKILSKKKMNAFFSLIKMSIFLACCGTQSTTRPVLSKLCVYVEITHGCMCVCVYVCMYIWCSIYVRRDDHKNKIKKNIYKKGNKQT